MMIKGVKYRKQSRREVIKFFTELELMGAHLRLKLPIDDPRVLKVARIELAKTLAKLGDGEVLRPVKGGER